MPDVLLRERRERFERETSRKHRGKMEAEMSVTMTQIKKHPGPLGTGRW